jgi:ElaB/YqjD/DUF883 family membrane-anchored ribosome-binding protein
LFKALALELCLNDILHDVLLQLWERGDLRQTVGQKTEEFRKAAADKAKEASSAAEHAWSSVTSKGRDWLAEAEAYVRKNLAQAVLIALGVGIIVGISLRKL